MDDNVVDLKVIKIKQWMEKMKDREQWRKWLLRRLGLTQGCSAERMDGWMDGWMEMMSWECTVYW
jgi:hypothetical protein